MSAIKVVARLRPVENETSAVQIHPSSSSAAARPSLSIYNASNKKKTTFLVDQVLGADARQDEVFHVAAKDTVDAFLEGYNGTIMCYGQTGAGKTYTLSGDHNSNNFERRGLMPRALEYIFTTLEEQEQQARRRGGGGGGGGGEWTVRVSYLELYKEQIFDLLALSDVLDGRNPTGIDEGSDGRTLMEREGHMPMHRTLDNSSSSVAFGYSSSARSAMVQGPSRLELVENRSGDVHAKGCKITIVRTLEAALNLLFEGETNRVIAEHQLNAASSRSHCVFTVHLERRSEDGLGQSLRSKLRLVDLAGSERVVRTGSVGQTLQEAKCVPFFVVCCRLLRLLCDLLPGSLVLVLLFWFIFSACLRCKRECGRLLSLLLTHTVILHLFTSPSVSLTSFTPHRYINKSLTFLEQMVIALGAKENGKRDHVPYRSSKLTHLLKDCVGEYQKIFFFFFFFFFFFLV